MINHYFFIRQLGQELAGLLVNARLVEAISPQKDALHCVFEKAGVHWLLKVNFQTQYSLVSCIEEETNRPSSYEKQFTQIWGETLTALKTVAGDRIWCLTFGNGMQLWVKLFGRLGNVLLCDQNGVLIGPFRRQLKNDYSFEAISIVDDYSFTQEINDSWGQKPKWWLTSMDGFLNAAHLAAFYTNCEWRLEENAVVAVQQGQTALEIANAFYRQHLPAYLLNQEKNSLLQPLKQQISRLEKRLIALKEQLLQLDTAQNYGHLGQLLLANLHNYQKGQHQLAVVDFLSGEQLILKVAPDKPLQLQAERFFKKAKKQHLEQEQIQSQIELTTASKHALEVDYNEILACEDWRSLKKWQKTQFKDPQHPFRRWYVNNFEIWMGRNAQENDLLLRQAHKDDCWLHARNFSGSHLVIRSAGKSIPQNILETAASWAAWHSKGKREGLCPVSYTVRKYVRKPKGAPAGAVLLDKERTVLVEPRQPPTNT